MLQCYHKIRSKACGGGCSGNKRKGQGNTKPLQRNQTKASGGFTIKPRKRGW